MIKKELEEIYLLEQFLGKISTQDQTISQLKQEFYNNSEKLTKGEVQIDILNNPFPEEKLLSLLSTFPQNSYEELEQIDNYIMIIQNGVNDYDLMKKKYLDQRQNIMNSGLKTDCVQSILEEQGDKNISSPIMQVLLGKFDKQGQSKPLWMFLDAAFYQLDKLREEEIGRYKTKKIMDIDISVKSRLKDLINLYENMDEILPSIDEIN